MLSKDELDRCVEWTGTIPRHIQREKIKRAFDFGDGTTYADKSKIMEVLQQTACLAETLLREIEARGL